MGDALELHLGSRLYVRRRQMGLTQRELAGMIGLTTQQIQKYEDGLVRISVARLWQLSQALDVSPAFFYDGLDMASPARAVPAAVAAA